MLTSKVEHKNIFVQKYNHFLHMVNTNSYIDNGFLIFMLTSIYMETSYVAMHSEDFLTLTLQNTKI